MEEKIAQYPELFPLDIKQDSHLKKLRHSIKLGLSIRRIEVAGVSDTIRPSFVMPYLMGKVSEVPNADEASLTKAYGVFKTEAQAVKSDDAPKTVNTDEWSATQKNTRFQRKFKVIWLAL